MDKRTRTCNFDGCDNPSRSRGLCGGHYQQRRSGQELRPLQPKLTLEQRFWAKVNKDAPSGCWEWTGALDDGYGQFWDGKRPDNAHRISWELTNGSIPAGMVIVQRCDNRKCVNPQHLRVVTKSESLRNQTRTRSNNTSGARGVSWHKKQEAWQVNARLHNRNYFGGLYSTLEAADDAARALRADLYARDDHAQWVKAQAAPPNNDGAA